MRARSFEGGSSSPKDEPLNWFDEFKARMSKRSQAKQQAHSTEENAEDSSSECNDPSTVSSTTKTSHSIKSALRLRTSDNNSSSIVKDSCDISSIAPNDGADDTQLDHDTSEATCKTTRFLGLRERKLKRISTVNVPDFDTASINTIFNRRDSRYDSYPRKPASRSLSSRCLEFLRWLISNVVPFNFSLPWKLLTFTSIAFVIIVITIIRSSNPNVMAFTFINGFLSGLFVAASCFVLLTVSLLAKILPKTRDHSPQSSATKTKFPNHQDSIVTPSSSFFDQESKINLSTVEQKFEDFSSFEVLDIDNQNINEPRAQSETVFDDDDYKGWMIEFIGDYELRNKSEIKLKLLYIRLENRVIYLCKPKSNHSDVATFPVFTSQRIYDLNKVKKFTVNLLLPKSVRNRQKLVWSKKYPLRLEFEDETADQVLKSPSDGQKIIQLTLFAKSCREKEEWFRKFKRIVEEKRLASCNLEKRASVQSQASGNDDNFLGVGENFRCRSPSPSGSVQTSRSSHILNESSKISDDSKSGDQNVSLTRTKSCELLHAAQDLQATNKDAQLETEDIRFGVEAADDSTLTRETAELFGQAIELSNFLDSRPNLCYQEYIENVIAASQDATNRSDWFNALTSRIFFDVFSHNYWSTWFKRKIQRKLRRIRLPYFMETLTLTKIDLGKNPPQFLNVVSHSFDSFGLSIDLDMMYSGGLTMTFETKLNLLKIKSDNASANNSGLNQAGIPSTATGEAQSSMPSSESSNRDSSSLSDFSSDNISAPRKPTPSSSGSTRTSGESSDSDESETDSSSDSSSDEADLDEISDWEDYGAEKTRQSIVKFVDRIASSRYFQHATENRYIKKKLQDISNCPLVLVVQIQSLNGVLTLNVPPPQTNRIWYGFKPNPELTLKALPKMGDREVNLSHVTDWIERKLSDEFRKILVIPNMEDIVLPVLKSDHLSYIISTK